MPTNEELQKRPAESRTKVRNRAQRYAAVADYVSAGLNGKPFHWRDCDRHYVDIAADMGLTLVSRSRAEKAGYELKRNQKPVGFAYFGAPISRTAALFVLECQFNKVAK